MKPEPSRLGGMLLAALSLAGLALCLMLLAKSSGSAAVGCGGSACDEVLGSRWSRVLGLPVAAFGAIAHAALLVSACTGARSVRPVLSGAVAGGALWLVFVQAVILRQFCPWCMAAHGVGALVVLCGLAGLRGTSLSESLRRTGFWGSACFLLLGLVQVYGPDRAGHVIEGSAGPADAAHARGRQVSFDKGRFVFDVEAYPLLGPADAERVLVECFDYRCAACRTMSGHLEALVSAHPGKVAVLMLPVPLDSACNPELAGASPHPGSCEITRIALAVWNRFPQDFASYHKELFGSPDPATARRLALRLMDEPALDRAMADPRVDRSIGEHIALWKSLSKTNDKLPKLLVGGSRIVHGLPSGREDFLRVMSRELGFPGSP